MLLLVFLRKRMCQLSEAIEYDQRDMKRDRQRAKNEPHQRSDWSRVCRFMPVQEM